MKKYYKQIELTYAGMRIKQTFVYKSLTWLCKAADKFVLKHKDKHLTSYSFITYEFNGLFPEQVYDKDCYKVLARHGNIKAHFEF